MWVMAIELGAILTTVLHGDQKPASLPDCFQHGEDLLPLCVGECVFSRLGANAAAKNQAPIFDSQPRGLVATLEETKGLEFEK
jgi:hypothetical protein